MSAEPPHKRLKTDEEDPRSGVSSNDEDSNQGTDEKQEQPEEGNELDESTPVAEVVKNAEESEVASSENAGKSEVASSENAEKSEVASSTTSHCDIIAEHYNTLEEKGVKARGYSRIFHMRNFNNWIKSAIISTFLDKIKGNKKATQEDDRIYVLDMGCGKGGDLLKWKDGKVTHVVFADLAETSVKQCEDRYKVLKDKVQRYSRNDVRMFSAEFIAADCTRIRLHDLYKDPSIKFDLVSCQFAFHYCWESLPQAECMFRNASECLKIGGFFVGTCPSAATVMSRLRKAGGKKFGNSVYSVSFEEEYPEGSTPPIFGTKYHFKLEGVVDCPEFLVHFDTLKKLAERWGFLLCIKQPFHSFYQGIVNNPEKKHLSTLLPKMTALEAYPPQDRSDLDGAEEEYSQAREKINKLREEGDTRDDICVGTLSQSEWEAVTLYLVFAFKKIKEPDLDR